MVPFMKMFVSLWNFIALYFHIQNSSNNFFIVFSLRYSSNNWKYFKIFKCEINGFFFHLQIYFVTKHLLFNGRNKNVRNGNVYARMFAELKFLCDRTFVYLHVEQHHTCVMYAFKFEYTLNAIHQPNGKFA